MKRKRQSEVWLQRDPRLWPKLPVELRNALTRGTADVERIRHEIARTAKVSSMPFVRTFAEVWMTPGRDAGVQGRAGFVRIHGRDHVVVDLAAPAVVCGDDEVLRALLVHEFSHCFEFLVRVVEGLDSGLKGAELPKPANGIYGDSVHDRELLVDPADWFGDDDVQGFMHHNDPRLEVCTETMLKLELFVHLPVVTDPSVPISASIIAIPTDVMAHIRDLRRRRES